MGQSAAETVKEIEQVRERLDGEIRELEDRLPPAYVAKRIAGAMFVGGSGTVFWWALRRARNRRTKKDAARSMQAVIQVVPDRWAKQVSDAMADGSWRRPAAYAAGAWAIFKLAELRQLRQTNKLLAGRA